MDKLSLHQLNVQFEALMTDYNAKCADYQRREVALMSAQEANTKNIAELTEATKGLVDAWNAANTLQRMVRWVAGFAGGAAILAWVFEFIKGG